MPYTSEEYEQAVNELMAHPVVMDIALSMPRGFPIEHLTKREEDGKLLVHSDAAAVFNATFDIGTMQLGQGLVERPVGAVFDAILRTVKEVGLAE